MATNEVAFANFCRFSPAMLHNQIWRRRNLKGQLKEKPKSSGGLKSLARFKTKQEEVKKKVSFRHDLLSDRSNPDDIMSPGIETTNSILLFVDISGFTRLCTKLSPETTRFHINTYFTLMMDIIYRFGGDVHKFIGDAIIVVWPVEMSSDKSELKKTALLALKCALNLVNSECGHYDKTEGDVIVKLRLHIGITYGKLHCYHIGVSQDEPIWDFLIAGKPLDEMASTLDNASHGEIGVSSSFYLNLVQNECEALQHESGSFIVKALICDDSEIFPANLSINKNKCNVYEFLRKQQERNTFKLLLNQSEHAMNVLSALVPGVARGHCLNNSLQFLSEIRKVTIIFVNVNSLIPNLDNGDLLKVQRCMAVLCMCIQQYQGTFVQFVYDDKGVVAIIAFGLPGQSLENDVHRGLLCSLSVYSELDAIGIRCHIGITTGQVYCGLVGSNYRCSFGVMGASMNLSARLMGICMKMKSHKRNVYMICNEDTRTEALQDYNCSFTFDQLEPVKAKGYDKPVNVYIPRRTMLRTDSKRDIVVASISSNRFYANPEVEAQVKGKETKKPLNRQNFVGREIEIETLKSRILEDQYDEFRMTLIIGPAGIGKSTLLRNFAQESLKSKRFKVISLCGDSDKLSPPLGCWGHVVRGALKGLHCHFFSDSLDDGIEDSTKNLLQDASKTLKILNHALEPKFRSKLLLLAPFFPVLKNIPLSRDLQAMKGSQQSKNFQVEMIIDLLVKFSVFIKEERTLLLIEDMHYLDILSWKLIEEFAVRMPSKLSLVCTSRPLLAQQKISDFVLLGYYSIKQLLGDKFEELQLSSLGELACGHLLQTILEDTLAKTRDIADDDESVTSIHSGDSIGGFASKIEDLRLALKSRKLLKLVFDRSNGNPLFLLGLADVIQTEIHKVLESKTEYSMETFYERVYAVLPENIHAVVIARFDKLSLVAQLVLKTASVVGFTFTSVMLKEVFHDKSVNFEQAFKELLENGFIIMLGRLNSRGSIQDSFKRNGVIDNVSEYSLRSSTSKSSIEFEYTFEHRLVFDSVYKLLLVEQKAAIHESLAKYYRRRFDALMSYNKAETEIQLTPTNSFHLKRLCSEKGSSLDVTREDTLDAFDPIKNKKSAINLAYTAYGAFSEDELEELNLYELHLKLAYHWSKTYNLPTAVRALQGAAQYSVLMGNYTEAEELLLVAWTILGARLDKVRIDLDKEMLSAKAAKLEHLSKWKKTDLASVVVSSTKVSQETFRSSFSSKVSSIMSSMSGKAENSSSLKLHHFTTLSFKDLLADGVLVSAESSPKYDEDVEDLLVAVTEHLCKMVQVYTRYRVSTRKEPKLQVQYLLEKAEFAQIYLKEKYNVLNEKAKAIVYHSKAWNLFGIFNTQFEKYLETMQDDVVTLRFTNMPRVPIPAADNIETYFDNAIKLRKSSKDWSNAAESLNGLGSFYEMFLKKLKKCSEFLISEGLVDRFINEAVPTLVRMEIRKLISLIWSPTGSETLYGVLFDTLCKKTKEVYTECKDIRSEYHRQELGQVHVSLGNFYLAVGNVDDLRLAKDHFDKSIKAYTLTQGNRNPRSAYALHGLAQCYLRQSQSKENGERDSYLAFSLANLCVQLRKLTMTNEDVLLQKSLKLLDSIAIDWPWDKNVSVGSDNLVLQVKRCPSVHSYLDMVVAQLREIQFYVGWSSKVGGPAEQEKDRCLLSYYCLYWILNYDYESLIECQRNEEVQNQVLIDMKNGIPVSPRLERAKSWHFLPLSDWQDRKKNKVRTNHMTTQQFNHLRLLFAEVLTDYEAAQVLIVLLSITNLFKVEAFVNEAEEFLEEKSMKSIEVVNVNVSDEIDEIDLSLNSSNACEKEILVRIVGCRDTCAHFLPSVASLSDEQQLLIRKGLSTGFELRQFVSLESVPGSLKALRKLAKSDPRAFDVYLRHLVLVIASHEADLSMKGSLPLQNQYTSCLLEGISLLDLLKRGDSEKSVYSKYLLIWSKKKSVDKLEETANLMALIRLCGMLKAYGEEQIQMVQDAWNLLTIHEQLYLADELEKNGLDDGWAIVPSGSPELLALFVVCVDEIEMEEVNQFDETSPLEESMQEKSGDLESTSIALSFGLQLLIKIFRSARVILGKSKLADEEENGVYNVITSHLAKEHVVRSILREEKFVKFSIFHQDTTGEIVLGEI